MRALVTLRGPLPPHVIVPRGERFPSPPGRVINFLILEMAELLERPSWWPAETPAEPMGASVRVRRGRAPRQKATSAHSEAQEASTGETAGVQCPTGLEASRRGAAAEAAYEDSQLP